MTAGSDRLVGVVLDRRYRIESQIARGGMSTVYRATDQVLETLPLAEYQQFSPLFREDVYPAIDLAACVEKRSSQGGTGQDSLQAQIEMLQAYL